MVPESAPRAEPSPGGPLSSPVTALVGPRTASAVIGIGTILTLAVLGRNLWFASDEWNIMTEYPSGNLLVPFNGHLSAVPVALYQVLFHTTGVVDHLPYRLLGLASLGFLSVVVVTYGRSRVGAWTAVLALAAVLWNSSGSTNLLFPFLLNFSLPIALLVVVWWCIDRQRTRADVGAGVALAAALACSGLGVVALIAVAVELAVARAGWRRWATIVAPGGLLWLAWWSTNRDAAAISRDVLRVGRYSARMLLGGTTSLAAGSTAGGVVLLVALGALVAVSLVRWRTGRRRDDARIWGALAAPAAFIGLTAVSRIDIVPSIPPDELRYGWTISAYLVLAALACWRPTPGDIRRLAPTARAAWFAGAVVVVLSALVLRVDLQRWVDVVETNGPGVRTNLFAAEAVGPGRIDPEIVMPLSFVPVTTGRYLSAVAQLGSPIAGASADEFGGSPEQLDAADALLRTSLRPVVAPADDAPTDAGADRACPAELPVPPGASVAIRSDRPGPVVIRRFGTAPVFSLDPGPGSWTIELPRDRPVPADAAAPYRLSVPVGTSCSAG
jgi:hypothetical protein